MQNENKPVMKAVETFQLSIKWDGQIKLSPEYATLEEAHANVLPFLKKFQGRFLQVAYVRNVRYVPA